MAKRGTTKYNSNKQEKRVAKDIGGKTQLASGSLWFASADARSDVYLVECKFTDSEKYVLTLATWEKIRREALRDGMRVPLMNVQLPEGNLAVIDLNDFYPLNMPPYSPKLVQTVQSKTRVALDSKMTQTDLDSEHTIPYSLALFEDTHLVVMNWEDFLLMNEE